MLFTERKSVRDHNEKTRFFQIMQSARRVQITLTDKLANHASVTLANHHLFISFFSVEYKLAEDKSF